MMVTVTQSTSPDEVPGEPRRDPVSRAVQEYAERQPDLQRTTDAWVALVTTLLDDAGINYLTVTGRTKSVASFAAKAARAEPGTLAHDDPLTGITDQVGVRVVTYLLSEVAAVVELLADQFEVLDDRDMGQETARQGRFGYSSRHLLVAATGRSPELAQPASIQVRTVLQHAWAEFEHDIRYKGTVPAEHASDLDRRFTLAAGLLELADREFSAIRARIRVPGPQQEESDNGDPRISGHDLAAFLTGQYADAGWSRTDHYSWISGLLLELGITSLDELGGLLTSVDSAAINARLEYRYPPGAVRRLDDALLAVFGNRYLDLHGNAHRRELLAARLEKLRAGDGASSADVHPHQG
jgi:ppGpp synthetase/RelA/SpoT-type nucleotidyltranferase